LDEIFKDEANKGQEAFNNILSIYTTGAENIDEAIASLR
jgi:hypothetical protein